MTAEAVDPALVELIRGRVATTRRHIASLTDRDVRIVCVTKGHPAAVAHAALAAGVADLGENYAQELIAKVPELAGLDPSPRWNFIGRLQSNKVRALAGIVDTWQSVDRASVATEIARRCPGADAFVQVDLAEIEGRGGCPVAEAPALVRRCRDLGLVVSGLMGVGPPGPPEASRSGFRLPVAPGRLVGPGRTIHGDEQRLHRRRRGGVDHDQTGYGPGRTSSPTRSRRRVDAPDRTSCTTTLTVEEHRCRTG